MPHTKQKLILNYLKKTHLHPKLFVKCTSNYTTIKQNLNAFLFAVINLKIQIIVPIQKLIAIQRLDVEIRSLNLKTNVNL